MVGVQWSPHLWHPIWGGCSHYEGSSVPFTEWSQNTIIPGVVFSWNIPLIFQKKSNGLKVTSLNNSLPPGVLHPPWQRGNRTTPNIQNYHCDVAPALAVVRSRPCPNTPPNVAFPDRDLEYSTYIPPCYQFMEYSTYIPWNMVGIQYSAYIPWNMIGIFQTL